MAHRLASHHRAFFSPKYFSGTSAHITTSSVFRKTFDIKSEDDFQSRVLQSKTPVIVDFHADWCSPCKALAPKLEAAVANQEGKVELAKVDVDEQGELAFQYGVNAVPTVLGIKNGQIVGQFQGLVDTPKIVELVEKLTK
ncbi:thioredoxin, mitochondrial-like [Actinia tenebrosa]|uniref:Thioredoxin, mitochondrial-like n=1 Tax=Actinia tenebrosa TaxID=6105 RepID=A0A6P8HUS7_ACTTE|nr:thioredoxin, mitochondrial-like [Actinia tenebrosa]